MDHSNAAYAGFFATFMIAYFIVLLAIVAFTIWVYWRIFTKAGYNGAMSLLNLIPGVGQFISMLILAFGRWPIEDQLDALRAVGPPAAAPPPATPGTSVMPV